jgi:hypothetical protein
VVAGVMIIVGAILMIVGYVFSTAVISLIIGGGFVAGFILGIVGGILGVMRPGRLSSVIASDSKSCVNCGFRLPRDAKFCDNCISGIGFLQCCVRIRDGAMGVSFPLASWELHI